MLAVRDESPIESLAAPETLEACDHERELAQLLVRHLGAAGAARACRDNNWHTVLHMVQDLPAGA